MSEEGVRVEARVRVEGLGLPDGMPYVRADLAAACQVAAVFAVSFYQLDYQAIVTTSAAAPPGVNPTIKAMPVAKIAMDEEGFRRLLSEVSALASKLGIVPDKAGVGG